MMKIQGKSILVRVSARFELARVRVIGSQLYSLIKFTASVDSCLSSYISCRYFTWHNDNVDRASNFRFWIWITSDAEAFEINYRTFCTLAAFLETFLLLAFLWFSFWERFLVFAFTWGAYRRFLTHSAQQLAPQTPTIFQFPRTYYFVQISQPAKICMKNRYFEEQIH